MPTENPKDKSKQKDNIIDFTLITINLNKTKNNNNYIPKQSFRVLNNYYFEEAKKYDQ